MEIAHTSRLRIRTITLDDEDVAFHLALMNDPAFIKNIGDRGVRTMDESRRYLQEGPVAMQEQRGHSMYVVELLDGTRIGMCGLIKRDTLEHVDIGYAYLPAYRGQGYAWEAAQAVVAHARALGITRLAGITSPGNEASIQLLLKLGMTFQHQTSFKPGELTNVYLADLGTAEHD